MAEELEEVSEELLEDQYSPSEPLQEEVYVPEPEAPASEAEQYTQGGVVDVQGMGELPIEEPEINEATSQEYSDVAPQNEARTIDDVKIKPEAKLLI